MPRATRLRSRALAATVGLVLETALAAAGARGQPLAPAAGTGWATARSESFEVTASGGAERASALALQLERWLVAARELTGARRTPFTPPLRVVSLATGEGLEYLLPPSGEPGFLQASPERTDLVLDAALPEQALFAAQHALVHYLFASGAAPVRPLWFEEGAAELLSTAHVAAGALEIGRPPRARLEWFALATLHPLQRVLTADQTLRWSLHAREGFAAEAWAFLHFLREGQHLEFPDREPQLASYLALVAQGRKVEEACAQAFGAPPAALEAELLRYLSFGDLPVRRIPLSALPVREPVAGGPLSGAERDLLLGRVALSLGGDARTPAERWLRAAHAALPARSDVTAELARVRAERGDPATNVEPLIVEAEAAGPSDAETLRQLGWARAALSGRGAAPDAGAQRKEALRLFRASLAAAPAQVDAHVGLARVAQLAGDANDAEAELGDARDRAPALPGLDLSLARIALDAGDVREGREALGRVLARPHAAREIDAEELESLLVRARVDLGGPIATRHLSAHLEVSAPPVVRGVREVELRGRGGRWEAQYTDVMLAIDESESTLRATGRDIDGNGRTGRNRGWERHVAGFAEPYQFQASGDPGDAIVSAEVAAARRLLAQFDPDTMRVGLVSFSGEAWLDAPLGSPERVLRTLRSFGAGYHDDGTSLAAALGTAFDALNQGRDREHARQRAIILLSDGKPTNPSPEKGSEQALEAADRLAHYGVPVHAFALGPEAVSHGQTYREIAERTGGRFVPVEYPAEVVSLLRNVRLTGLERIAIRNLQSSASAPSPTLLPDGSFRATVPVVPGVNTIEVTAQVEGREPLVVKRQVLVYEGDASEDPLEAQPADERQPTTNELEARERRRLRIERDDAEGRKDRQ